MQQYLASLERERAEQEALEAKLRAMEAKARTSPSPPPRACVGRCSPRGATRSAADGACACAPAAAAPRRCCTER